MAERPRHDYLEAGPSKLPFDVSSAFIKKRVVEDVAFGIKLRHLLYSLFSSSTAAASIS